MLYEVKTSNVGQATELTFSGEHCLLSDRHVNIAIATNQTKR